MKYYHKKEFLKNKFLEKLRFRRYAPPFGFDSLRSLRMTRGIWRASIKKEKEMKFIIKSN